LVTPIVIAPVVSVMRLHPSWVRSMVSPSTALLTASRKLPGPLSSQLVTIAVGVVGVHGSSGGDGRAVASAAVASAAPIQSASTERLVTEV